MGNGETPTNVLVVFYSMTGNVARLARCQPRSQVGRGGEVHLRQSE